jgi:exodeoxyribonuclease VII large subunit
LSPKSTLDRGYAIVQGPNGIVRTPADAPSGTPLVVALADGALDAESMGEHPSTGEGDDRLSPAAPASSPSAAARS